MRINRPQPDTQLPAVVEIEENGGSPPVIIEVPLSPSSPPTAIADSTLYEDIQAADILYKSGFFPSVQNAAQALAKMRLGRELGVGPMTGLKELYVVGGRLAMSAALMAALIRRSKIYDYHIERLDEEVASIVIIRNGEPIGRSVFTVQDAKNAGLVNKDVWTKYKRNLLYARAMSNAARWYCPDLFAGSVYIPEEIDLNVVETITE